MKLRIARTGALTGLLAALAVVAPALARPASGGPAQCPPPGSSAQPPQPDQLGHPLNYVLAENCQSGTERLMSHLQVTTSSNQNDQPTNLAYAYSHGCASGCESIAVAYQVVLVDQQNSSQSPQNAAVAINDSCTGCATFAYADQYAVDVPPGTHLSDHARQELDQIEQQAKQDIRSGESFSDLDSQLKDLAAQLKQDVDNDLAHQNVTPHDKRQSQGTNEHGQPQAP